MRGASGPLGPTRLLLPVGRHDSGGSESCREGGVRRRWDGLGAGSGSESCFSWPGDVSQIFDNEVMAHQNPDFWLCFMKPQGLATAGP